MCRFERPFSFVWLWYTCHECVCVCAVSDFLRKLCRVPVQQVITIRTAEDTHVPA
jgi:hypothetical protein